MRPQKPAFLLSADPARATEPKRPRRSRVCCLKLHTTNIDEDVWHPSLTRLNQTELNLDLAKSLIAPEIISQD